MITYPTCVAVGERSVLGGALLFVDADGHCGTVTSEELTTSSQDQEQVDGEQGLAFSDFSPKHRRIFSKLLNLLVTVGDCW